MFDINSTVQTVHWNRLKIVGFVKYGPDSKVCPIWPLDSVIHKGSWPGQASPQRRKCQVSTNLWMNSLLITWPWEARENQGPVQAIKTVADAGEGPSPCPLSPYFEVHTEARRAEKNFFWTPPPPLLIWRFGYTTAKVASHANVLRGSSRVRGRRMTAWRICKNICVGGYCKRRFAFFAIR